ncbi:amino acid/amide ABC transporter membrane protein 2 (HAAT family) [Trinickia symbiotica]|uniref:Branched-chain amino acid ABC transporter permease n=1 Tax=Trinickia symbiotica TaxID=863227 RepID=A0A2N7X8E9_9BURK|nr:branched-chain amino acid ABC transporter permease [Trinickia symbiotica]PMS37887.1 branched-chain amino acid ABC transporter permease [Trinickia symbiotica]PPK47490.1 amino acid/amide ABC transporter membrane protein 2 (HAAT family) [Trinickia symbiotica]
MLKPAREDAPIDRGDGEDLTSAVSAAAPWIALAVYLLLPVFVVHDSALFAFLAQSAVMIVLALSYNLLLGQAGLLSFGHAAYAGLAAFVAAHVFNRGGIALPWLPLVGGAAGAAFGAVFGFVATRRAGTAFAMITLGIGELASAAALTLPAGFGGAAGVSIDRASGPAWGGWTFGPTREAYAVIAVWALLSVVAMFALTRTPLARLSNAVRDNAARVATLGVDPRRLRYAMFVVSSFFAGVAGTLGLIDVELASADGVGMARSGSVLIATVIGGSATFFGPVAGALVLSVFSVMLAGVTRAWSLYLGLLFVMVVMCTPHGIAESWAAHRSRIAWHGWQRLWFAYLLQGLCAISWMGALVLMVETLYASRLAADSGGVWALGRLEFDIAAPSTWAVAAALCCVGALARRCACGILPRRGDVL